MTDTLPETELTPAEQKALAAADAIRQRQAEQAAAKLEAERRLGELVKITTARAKRKEAADSELDALEERLAALRSGLVDSVDHERRILEAASQGKVIGLLPIDPIPLCYEAAGLTVAIPAFIEQCKRFAAALHEARETAAAFAKQHGLSVALIP